VLATYVNSNATMTLPRVETVKPKIQVEDEHTFWAKLNTHTALFEIYTTMMGRDVIVCRHKTLALTQECIDGKGCAFGTPVGRFK
jgi:hypothetical protein